MRENYQQDHNRTDNEWRPREKMIAGDERNKNHDLGLASHSFYRYGMKLNKLLVTCTR